MDDTRTQVSDEQLSRETWVKHAVPAPFLDVFVLVAHPEDSTSFVVGAYASREEAEQARAALATGAPAEVLSYHVDFSGRGRRRGW